MAKGAIPPTPITVEILSSTSMSPQQFISKWRASTVNERAASQEHFIDLCRLLDEPTPIQADPTGTFYRFEKRVSKARGGDGSAGVWKRGPHGDCPAMSPATPTSNPPHS